MFLRRLSKKGILMGIWFETASFKSNIIEIGLYKILEISKRIKVHEDGHYGLAMDKIVLIGLDGLSLKSQSSTCVLERTKTRI